MQRRGVPAPWADACWVIALVIAVAAAAPLVEASNLLPLAPVVVALCLFAGRLMSSLRLALVAFAFGLAAAMMINVVRSPDNLWSVLFTTLLIAFALCLFPWSLGRSWRLRLEQGRREQHAVAEGARMRERARIAQDMHDSLGHDLALIALRSGAMELAPEATDQQQAAAAELRSSAVAATDRLHQIIDVLRQDSAATDRPADADGLEELINRTREAGASVRLQRTPPIDAQPLSIAAAQTLYRVAQESITNAVKHAPGGAISLRIDETSDPIMIKVDSDRLESAAIATRTDRGQGLTGLDERLKLIGGTFSAVPHSDSFVVQAEIPRQGRIDPDREAFADDRNEPRLHHVRRTGRRRMLQTAILPFALAAVLVGTLVALQAITVTQTALSPDNYAQIHQGQTVQEIAPLLPAHQQDGPPPILTVPPAPAGADCEFYQARTGIFDLSQDMFRLCFADGVVVSKDHLR